MIPVKKEVTEIGRLVPALEGGNAAQHCAGQLTSVIVTLPDPAFAESM